MKKPNIKKLKYPLWFNITFYLLTVLFPIVSVLIDGFKSPNRVFRITFSIIAGLIIIWTFVNKFIISTYKKKLTDEKSKLEHEYEIEVGSSEKIKWLWFTNEQKLSIFAAVQSLLIGALIIVLAIGASDGCMTIKGLTAFVAICYVVAYIMKFVTITVLKGKEDEETTIENGGENNEG